MLTHWLKVGSQICQEILNWIYKQYINAKIDYALALNTI